MQTLDIWNSFATKPFGKTIFSKLVCFKAPYFATIKLRFEELCPSFCELRISKRRRVQNHLGTVHAIAMCNMAELAGGTMTEVSVPANMRWIPKGMTVEYIKKATTNLVAKASPSPGLDWTVPGEKKIQVEVFDSQETIVFKAEITMWTSEK